MKREKLLICENCGLEWETKSNLKIHKFLSHREKPIKMRLPWHDNGQA